MSIDSSAATLGGNVGNTVGTDVGTPDGVPDGASVVGNNVGAQDPKLTTGADSAVVATAARAVVP